MSDYRDEFQRLLESTYIPSNGNKSKIVKEFNAFLDNTFQHTPEKLYRYRKCDQYSIDSFRNGTIFVCNASRFSDKYDSRVYIDREKIVNDLKDGFTNAIHDLVFRAIKEKNPNLIQEEAAR